MITKEIALSLGHRMELVHVTKKDSRGQPMRVRVNGQCQTWKSPARISDFKLPVKYGLKECGYITPANAAEWTVL